MDKDKEIILSKQLLSRIFQAANERYLFNGYSDGNKYLDSKEMIARAYAEATLAVLKQNGFVLVEKK